MSAKQNKKRKRQTSQQPAPPSKQGFLRRHSTAAGTVGGIAGVASLIIALIALNPSIRSTSLAEEANKQAQNADLSIIKLDLTSTVELSEETIFNGAPADTSKNQNIQVSAAKITLHNQGAQPALIKETKVQVLDYWAPEGCHGAGPSRTSVLYDFTVPGDIKRSQLPLPLPSKKEDFEVAGQANDQLAITVGEEYVGEAGWPGIVSASAELVSIDGNVLKSDPFTLMNLNAVDRVIHLVKEGLGFGLDRSECIQKNIKLLEEAIDAPGDHSPSIDLLLSRLREIGYTSTSAPIISSAPEPTPPVPSVPLGEGIWVAQLGTYSVGKVTEAQMLDIVGKLEQKTGTKITRVRSSAYGSLNPGYWFLYHEGERFKDGYGPLAFCISRGISDENECVGRYLSRSEDDKKYTCKFSTPQNSPNCIRR
ncbi:hypothetical protein GCM10011609_71190 [Lentzea pudingi]|uniref:PASTA domain-containing protein n=1 Tax=Lentzea pudingi TaxID=1789439 RepID=A0ABQ2IQN1_9PSEU|nr:hypothetical protein [Lentzea pudingi]GGN19874.1 hypothetical protein GCM10011609_71190 [Lentzea pudingi]